MHRQEILLTFVIAALTASGFMLRTAPAGEINATATLAIITAATTSSPVDVCDVAADQSNPVSCCHAGWSVGDDIQELGQVFTVGVTGTLESVSLEFRRSGQPEPMILDIRRVSGGVIQPDPSDVLASASLPWEAFPTTDGLVRFEFLDEGLSVTAGDELAFVVRHDSGRYTTRTSQNNDYAAGGVQRRVAFEPSDPFTDSGITQYDLYFSTEVVATAVCCADDSVACCTPDGLCESLHPTCCSDADGQPKGPGSVCAGDADGDEIDDLCPCPDVDGDADVDLVEFARFQRCMGYDGLDDCLCADLDFSGFVDLDDFSLLTIGGP